MKNKIFITLLMMIFTVTSCVIPSNSPVQTITSTTDDFLNNSNIYKKANELDKRHLEWVYKNHPEYMSYDFNYQRSKKQKADGVFKSFGGGVKEAFNIKNIEDSCIVLASNEDQVEISSLLKTNNPDGTEVLSNIPNDYGRSVPYSNTSYPLASLYGDQDDALFIEYHGERTSAAGSTAYYDMLIPLNVYHLKEGSSITKKITFSEQFYRAASSSQTCTTNWNNMNATISLSNGKINVSFSGVSEPTRCESYYGTVGIGNPVTIESATLTLGYDCNKYYIADNNADLKNYVDNLSLFETRLKLIQEKLANRSIKTEDLPSAGSFRVKSFNLGSTKESIDQLFASIDYLLDSRKELPCLSPERLTLLFGEIIVETTKAQAEIFGKSTAIGVGAAGVLFLIPGVNLAAAVIGGVAVGSSAVSGISAYLLGTSLLNTGSNIYSKVSNNEVDCELFEQLAGLSLLAKSAAKLGNSLSKANGYKPDGKIYQLYKDGPASSKAIRGVLYESANKWIDVLDPKKAIKKNIVKLSTVATLSLSALVLGNVAKVKGAGAAYEFISGSTKANIQSSSKIPSKYKSTIQNEFNNLDLGYIEVAKELKSIRSNDVPVSQASKVNLEQMLEVGSAKDILSTISSYKVFGRLSNLNVDIVGYNAKLNTYYGDIVNVNWFTTEKIGDRVIYTYEIAVEGKNFYFDNRVLSNINKAVKLAKSDSSFIDKVNFIQNPELKASLLQDIQSYPEDQDIETRVRVWVNDVEYSGKTSNGEVKGDIFENELDSIAVDNQSSELDIDSSANGEKKNSPECDKTDFGSQKGEISHKTIKCRVKYVKLGVERNPIKRRELKDRMEVVNSIRRELVQGGESSWKKSVFGFAVITNISTDKIDIDPLSIDIKAVSGSKDFDNFAPKSFQPPQDRLDNLNIDDTFQDLEGYYYDDAKNDNPLNSRVFKTEIIMLPGKTNTNPSYRGNDTEIKLLEGLANKYYKDKTKRQSIIIEIFTDREACQGCSSVIERINNNKEQTGNLFKITPIEQGIYHTVNLLGTKLTENIYKKPEGYYKSLNEDSVQ